MRTLALALALFAARDVWDPSCVGVGVAAELADQEFVEAREKTPTGPGRRAANFNRKKSKRKSWGSMFGGGEDGGPSKPCAQRQPRSTPSRQAVSAESCLWMCATQVCSPEARNCRGARGHVRYHGSWRAVLGVALKPAASPACRSPWYCDVGGMCDGQTHGSRGLARRLERQNSLDGVGVMDVGEMWGKKKSLFWEGEKKSRWTPRHFRRDFSNSEKSRHESAHAPNQRTPAPGRDFSNSEKSRHESRLRSRSQPTHSRARTRLFGFGKVSPLTHPSTSYTPCSILSCPPCVRL